MHKKREPIQDDFSNLSVSRQRKWQLRNREKQRLQATRYRLSERGKLLSRMKYIRRKLRSGKGTEKDMTRLIAITNQLNQITPEKKTMPLMSKDEKAKLYKELFG